MRGNLDAVANGEVMQQGDDDNSVEVQASETNSVSDESEVVTGPYETLTTPISADPTADPPSDDLDERDVVEWIDEIDFSVLNSAEGRMHTVPTHKWRGVNWDTLAILKISDKQFGLFLGFENFDELPTDWHVSLNFHYEILGDDGTCLIKCPDVSHHFMYNKSESRIDRGNWNSAELPKLFNLKNTVKTFPKVKVKVHIEEQFSPAKVPINYDSKTTTGMVGLENLGATCYLNALLQMLFHINSFRKAVYMLPHTEEVFKSSTTLALQSVFSTLQSSRKEVTTKDLTVAFGWTTAESFMQQDVQEMMRVLMDKLETKMTGTVVDGFIKKMFAGTVRSFIQCLNVDYVSQREEVFYDIQLDVKGCKNIFDSLNKYIEPEVLDGDNQYSAEGHGKQDAKKGEIFTKFPPVLTIHLKRFDFDYNTMGFTKIHDHYEFPERMNLDKYLAENCPPESRAVPNDYVLHSVLVHAGDVGGGHYYAYIRPTTSTFDYSNVKAPSSRSARDTQWFKFNDDIVMRVQSKEAIEHTYGRRSNDFKSGFSSAYMLVYIRAAEAAEIMAPVKQSDVPTDLALRLEAELKERRDAERAEIRDKMFTVIQYATEDDVRKFTRYSRTNDFITVSDMNGLKVLKGCKRFGMLLQIANELQVSPALIRLWHITNCNGIDKLKGPLRVAEDFDIEQLKGDLGDDHYYYVQILKEEDFEPKQLARFEHEFAKLQKDEKDFLDKLRELVLAVPALAELFSVEDDPVEGCGLGSNNFHYFRNRNIPEDVKTKVAELRQFVNHLNGQFMDEYSQVMPPIGSDSVLVFLRAFDPTNSLPLLSDSHSLTLGESGDGNDGPLTAEDAALATMLSLNHGGDDALGSLVNRQLYIGADSRQSSPGKAKDTEYIPLKYVGCVMMKKQATVQEILKEFKGLLLTKMGDQLPHEWLDSPSQRLYFEYNSTKNVLVDLHEDSHQVIQNLSNHSQTAVFIVDIPKLCLNASAPNLLAFRISDPSDWLRYRSFRRMFYFKPIHMRERIIVNKLRNEALLGSPSFMDTEESINSEGYSPRDTKKTLSSDQGSTVSMTDTTGLAAGGAAAGTGSPFGPDASEFNMYLPNYDKLLSVFELLEQNLLVDRRHLILYFVPSNFVSDNVMDSVQESAPVTLMLHDQQIYTITQKNMSVKSTAYHVFYHISPFPLVTDEGTLTFETHKCHEILINDARLRKWRQHFMDHQDLSSVSQPPSLSASALKLNNSGTVPSGSSQEDAEGSPPITNNADLKRRRLSPQPSDVLDSIHDLGGPSASALTRAQWPVVESNKYDIMELNRVHLRISNHLTGATLCSVLRALIGLPTNMDEILGPTEYLTGRGDIEALDGSHSVLSDPNKVAQFSNFDGVVTDSVRASGLNQVNSLLPTFPLAILVIRNNVVNQIYHASVPMKGSVYSWMDAHDSLGTLFYLAVMYMSPLDMVFISNKHPTIRSMPVSVFNFTLLGSVVQHCDLDQFGGPFITYVREDDDYDSFFARVRAISGDSEEEWEKVRPAVVRNRIPFMIRKPTIAQVSSRLGNTRLSSSDSLDHLAANENKDEDAKTTGSTGGAENKSIYEHFRAHFSEFHGRCFSEIRLRDDPSKWYYPQLGLQRSVADAGRKYVAKKAIKIA